MTGIDDSEGMALAIAAADAPHPSVSPNPRVGCAIVTIEGVIHTGATEPPPGRHAERVALDAAGEDARGATAFVTLEPCGHHGRTPPCADALIDSGVDRVVVAIEDPDPLVAGEGVELLREAGVSVDVGERTDEVEAQLAAYLTHRRTGRPYVTLKLAATLDGRTAAPDRTSQWITGEAARADAHRLRAASDAILVGAGTVRADDPSLTVRHVDGTDPLRVVLGQAPSQARVHPCREMSGELPEILDELGADEVVRLLVEGGATVAADFHRAGLVDRYVVYLAPALMGGDDAPGLFAGPAVTTIGDVWRGRITDVVRLGDDLRIDLLPNHEPGDH
ncbi:MAG TPA: bifunctional diaminohydroxyphosphoribosylaminopyrimidine deaminase/5-amino-6-(5-phosphoribosylamino)uracil reductase RibD [Acidimicrobiales bacterium]|nr:bifunctional diaminohydroxyphosphoribosylaminopyrimidine deaminase/5-amino-6-(5-phosphoribosylamino)uracil reductase RibD [Acidimicrobiales bacterium]